MPGLPVENISMGGVFVRTSAALDTGTPVMLQVVRPGLKRAIQVTGRVVSSVSCEEARARGLTPGMGIGFDPVDGDAAERLRALIDVLTTASPSPPPPPVFPTLPAATAAPVAPAAPALPQPTVHVVDATFLQLAEARGEIEERDARIAKMEEEMMELRRELLRRNRTIGQLGLRLSRYESV
jgi:Tfp pilus assembly protein PilZ